MSYHDFVPGPESSIEIDDTYLKVAETCSDSDIIVQVGVGLGRTTCLMCGFLKDQNKRPHFYAIDPFGLETCDDDLAGHPDTIAWGEKWTDWLARIGGPSYVIDHFDFYLANCPEGDRLTERVQFPPWHSAQEFKDASVYFVHLNTLAPKDQVEKQIAAWWPRVKVGGIMLVGSDDIRTKGEDGNQIEKVETEWPFEVGDKICELEYEPTYGGGPAFKVALHKPHATVTELTHRGFKYQYDTDVSLNPFQFVSGGECFPNGYHMWRKV